MDGHDLITAITYLSQTKVSEAMKALPLHDTITTSAPRTLPKLTSQVRPAAWHDVYISDVPAYIVSWLDMRGSCIREPIPSRRHTYVRRAMGGAAREKILRVREPIAPDKGESTLKRRIGIIA